MNKLDIYIFHLINGKFHNDILTPFFLFITNTTTLAIFFLILLVFFSFLMKKKALFFIPVLCAGVGFSDFTGNLIKHWFKVPRPCNPVCYISGSNFDLGMKTSFSFPSNHALNWFFIAFMFLLLSINKKKYRFISMILLYLAMLISYSRIYTGVHFPSDVLGSMLIASLYSLLYFKIYKIIINKWKNYKSIKEV